MIVMVFWEDAAFHLDDTSPEIHDVCTIGFVLEDNLDYIRVASERLIERGATDPWHRAITVIPKRSVTKIVELDHA